MKLSKAIEEMTRILSESGDIDLMIGHVNDGIQSASHSESVRKMDVCSEPNGVFAVLWKKQ